MTQRNRQKRLDVVGKLRTQATSVTGRPEADVFTSRVFTVNAKFRHRPEGRVRCAAARCGVSAFGILVPRRLGLEIGGGLVW